MFGAPRGSRANKQIGGRRGAQRGKAPVLISFRLLQLLVAFGAIAIVVLYIYIAGPLIRNDVVDNTGVASSPQQQQVVQQEQRERQAQAMHKESGTPPKQYQTNNLESPATTTTTTTPKKQYQDWRKIAVDLAAQSPDVILSTLQTHDPFGVREFEKRLLDDESKKGAFLTPQQLQDLFPCPSDNNRITLPDQRNRDKDTAFRRKPNNKNPSSSSTYLFFQHLRKAGGTNFCALAQDNLPRSAVAKYFCMPDMEWSGNKKCAGCMDSYTNEQIDTNMHTRGHRILGNEWDSFDASRFFDLDAILTTSFRKPLDRALSQFRFECIEERGCKIKKVEEWWTKRKDLTNVYTWTFAKTGIRNISVATTKEASAARQEVMGKALDVVAKFHLVLVMEWLAYATSQVETVLGFTDTTALTKRVRPHISQAKRDDGQETNKLGAAGITKASWDPKEYLSREQYKIMSENLALDEILTDAARRMFLERLVCNDV